MVHTTRLYALWTDFNVKGLHYACTKWYNSVQLIDLLRLKGQLLLIFL